MASAGGEIDIEIGRTDSKALCAPATTLERTEITALELGRPETWIWENYGRRLVRKIKRFTLLNQPNREDGISFKISLAQLQRIQLIKLRIKLAQHIADWDKAKGATTAHNGADTDQHGHDMENDLHRYVQALQDYEYMEKFEGHFSNTDPFYLTGQRKVDRIILEAAFAEMDSERVNRLNNRAEFVPSWGDDLGYIVPSRSGNYYAKLTSRIVVALVGASFLIGPMWLMMLDARLYVALGSTTGFVVLFGVTMAWTLDQHIHVLSSTAAYAAVLVVFVGLRGQGNAITG